MTVIHAEQIIRDAKKRAILEKMAREVASLGILAGHLERNLPVHEAARAQRKPELALIKTIME